MKEARIAKGLSQESLANISSISLRTIQRIEKGIIPRASTLRILCETLDLDFNQIINPESTEDIQRETQVLKRMNLLVILFMVVPPANVLFPLLLWKAGKRLTQKADEAGKIISFQIIWIATTFLLFFSGVVAFNLVTGNAGEGHFVGFIVIGFCLIWNIFIVSRSTIAINTHSQDFLTKTPNFF